VTGSADTTRSADSGEKVAFILSRFPKVTETFILYEILELERNGVAAEVFALRRENQPVTHPEARAMLPRVHFARSLSRSVMQANIARLARQPRRYLGALGEALGGTLGSGRLFLGALVYFPKAVYFAGVIEQLRVVRIHAHFATHPALAALVIHRLTGLPYSFTAHGSDLHVDPRMLDRKLDAADFAVTCSAFNKEAMVRASSPAMGDRIHVIYYGVDLALFRRGEPRPSRGVPEIICVASLEEVKGHRFLIEACRQLSDRGVAYRLHLVGDGPLRTEVSSWIARAHLEDRVLLHGPRDREQVAQMMREADIKVLASYPSPDGKREGMPNVLIEAMAAGLPVVSTRLTGIPELVESGVSGLLVPPGNGGALADALQQLCQDESLRLSMGAAGRKRVEQQFDRSRNARQLASHFRLQPGA
jgi:colanic acid/amylovoran biosynthesis glycosyltransferase